MVTCAVDLRESSHGKSLCLWPRRSLNPFFSFPQEDLAPSRGPLLENSAKKISRSENLESWAMRGSATQGD